MEVICSDQTNCPHPKFLHIKQVREGANISQVRLCEAVIHGQALQVGALAQEANITVIVRQFNVVQAETLEVGTVTESRTFNTCDRVVIDDDLLDSRKSHQFFEVLDLVATDIELLHTSEQSAGFLTACISQ